MLKFIAGFKSTPKKLVVCEIPVVCRFWIRSYIYLKCIKIDISHFQNIGTNSLLSNKCRLKPWSQFLPQSKVSTFLVEANCVYTSYSESKYLKLTNEHLISTVVIMNMENTIRPINEMIRYKIWTETPSARSTLRMSCFSFVHVKPKWTAYEPNFTTGWFPNITSHPY